MYAGFPLALLDALSCPDDAGPLRPTSETGREHLHSGSLACDRCGGSFPVEAGIVRLLRRERLEGESAHERRIRDENARRETLIPMGTLIREEPEHAMEILPTFEALTLDRSLRCLEAGCGRGKYTVALARRSAAVLAVDFSFVSLQRLAERLESTDPVGLVEGDLTEMRPGPLRFDRVLSTVLSNLPTAVHRDRFQRYAAGSLTSRGRHVFTVHNQSLRERVARIPQAARYAEGDLFRYRFTRREIREETAEWFAQVEVRPVRIVLPFSLKLRLPQVPISRRLARVPGTAIFADQWLVVGSHPRAADG